MGLHFSGSPTDHIDSCISQCPYLNVYETDTAYCPPSAHVTSPVAYSNAGALLRAVTRQRPSFRTLFAMA
jgi:hypothetical protein